MSMEFDADTVSAPRLVVMKRGDGGYGFNLHGERNVQAGQTISAVDDGSEAQKAGLRVGDKVIEVNGLNVEKTSHSDVVKRIKTNPNEVSMLVVDHITQAYLKQEGRSITADMANLMTVYQDKEVSAEPEAQPEEPEPTPVIEESVPEVQESDASAPTPTEQETEPPKEEATTTEAEIANDATTPEEVKQLNEVLDKEDADVEIPAPAPAEPQTNGMEHHQAPPEPTPTPTPAPAPVVTPTPAPLPARPTSKPLRSTIKQQKAESWDEKYKKFQQL